MNDCIYCLFRNSIYVIYYIVYDIVYVICFIIYILCYIVYVILFYTIRVAIRLPIYCNAI